MEEILRYQTFNNFLKENFGQRVYRIPIDAGFTCPNRDGTRAFGGCTFCDDRGSGSPNIDTRASVWQQLEDGIARTKRRYKAQKFLAYFQAFTNTYAPEGVLRELYDITLQHPEVVGLCIGTRPDCLPDNVLDLLSEYNQRTFVWLEIGLQTAFNHTLQLINRGHSAEEFFDSIQRAKHKGLRTATHLIFGLPGENREHMLSTVTQVAASKVDGIKIHQLCVYKGTTLEVEYKQGRLSLLTEEEYVDLVVSALCLLPPEMIIMRLVAEGSQDELIAPAWSFEKNRIMKSIDAELRRLDVWQGKYFQPFDTVTPALVSKAAPMIPA